MHNISFTTDKKEIDKELVMTQYTLKLLTILSNIIVSNLNLIDEQRTDTYIQLILAALKDENIQSVKPMSNSDHEAFFVGCSLLKELAYAFVS
jgi:hypothetical protein